MTLGGGGGVGQQRVGHRGEIKVLGEQRRGWNDVRNLEHPAVPADNHPERKPGLVLRKIGRFEQAVGQGLESQVQDRMSRSGSAGATEKDVMVANRAGH